MTKSTVEWTGLLIAPLTMIVLLFGGGLRQLSLPIVGALAALGVGRWRAADHVQKQARHREAQRAALMDHVVELEGNRRSVASPEPHAEDHA